MIIMGYGLFSKMSQTRLPLFRVAAIALLLSIGACDNDRNLAAPAGSAAGGVTSRLLPQSPCSDPSAKAAALRDLLRAVNAERTKAHLEPLRMNNTLSQIAEFYACRMADDDFIAHIDPYNGSTVDRRASDFGYAFLKIGENLAAGQRTIDEAMAAWLASPGHRANILDPTFTEIGLAIKEGGRLGPYWVQEFGRPATAPTSE